MLFGRRAAIPTKADSDEAEEVEKGLEESLSVMVRRAEGLDNSLEERALKAIIMLSLRGKLEQKAEIMK